MNEFQKSENACDFEKLRPLLNDALDALRENEREAVLLRFFEGRAFGEIGAKLRMSEDAARMRVARAVEKMRAQFARRGVTSSAAMVGSILVSEAAHAAPLSLTATVSAGAMASTATGITTGAAALAGTGGILIFMTSTKMMTGVAVAVLIALGSAFYVSHRGHAAELLLNEARRENAQLLGRLQTAQKRQQSSQAKAAAAEKPRDPVALGEAFLAAYPKARETRDALARAKTAGQYYRLRHELGMSDAQWEEFLRIRGAALSFGMSTSRGGFWGEYDGMKIEAPKPDKNWRDNMKLFLGEAGYARFEQEEKYITAFSGRVAEALYFTEAPLSAEQAKQMDALITSELRSRGNSLEGRSAAWQTILEQARAFLTEPQWQALDDEKTTTEWLIESSQLRANLGGKNNE